MKPFIFLLLFSLSVLAQETGQTTGKWSFRFSNNFSSNNPEIMRNYLSPDDREIQLRKIINNAAINYTDHNERLGYLKGMCSGLSEIDKIRMARYLSDLAGDIYDYDRINGGPNKDDVVTSENQWQAMHNKLTQNGGRTRWGVCRDMTDTVAEFLLTCGVPKDRIAIESYRTQSGGHQVVQVFGEDGKTYMINWSELYEVETSPNPQTTFEPNLTRIGIEHTRYDAETGKVIDQRQTELGMILAAVTHGRVDDDNYLPDLMILEATNGILSANAYQSQTTRGDLIKGMSMVYKESPYEWLHLSTGITYANTTLEDLDRGNGYSDRDIKGHILFMQIYGEVDVPEIHFFKKEKSKLYLKNKITYDQQDAYMWNSFNEGDYEFNYGGNRQMSLNSSLVYSSPKIDAMMGVDYAMGINKKRFNNETAGAWNGGYHLAPFSKSFMANTKIVIKAGKLNYVAGGYALFYSYGVNSGIFAGIENKEKQYEILASFFDQTLVNDASFQMFQVDFLKQFKTKKGTLIDVGLQFQEPINDGNGFTPNGQVQLKITPNWGKKKKRPKF